MLHRRLIVFYDKQTGVVLTTSQGGSITCRKQIMRFLPNHDISKVGFYYEYLGSDVIVGSDKVIFKHNGLPPFLCDFAGAPKNIGMSIRARREEIQHYGKVKFDFEFGMGDQVLQLEAYKAFIKTSPEIYFLAGIDPIYRNIFKYFSPIPPLSDWGATNRLKGFIRYELNCNHNLWDPRGGLHGKSCLFGADMGLDFVKESISLTMPPEGLRYWANQTGLDFTKIPPPILGVHFHCNSRNTSNWKEREAFALTKLWFENTGGHSIFLGDPSHFTSSAPHLHFHAFPVDWASTASTLFLLNLLVCVDSGPMHLARAAQIPHLVIWGGSGPRDICGRDPAWYDIRGEVDCVDQICMSCPKGDPICINSITARRVWEVIKSHPHLMVPIGTNPF